MGGENSKQREKELREKDMEARRQRQAAEKQRMIEEEERRRKELADQILTMKLQSCARGYLGRKEYNRMLGVAARRAKIAAEMLSTEKSYVHGLQVLIALFFHPLEDAADISESKVTRENYKRRKTKTFATVDSIAEHYHPGEANNRHSQMLNANRKSRTVQHIQLRERSSSNVKNHSSNDLPSMVEHSVQNESEEQQDLSDVPSIPGLKTADVRAIFSQVEVIWNYNMSISERLEERLATWTWHSRLGDLYLDMADFLKVYVQYVQNYNVALETLEKLKQIPEFVQWLQKTESLPEVNNGTITSFLIMPIQRIPRYVMLLEDFFKHTPPNHSDFENVELALKKVRDVATLINEKKRQAEEFSILIDIFNRLDPPDEGLCQAHRRFIKEGSLKDADSGNTFVFLLFNDCFIKAKEKGKKLKRIQKVIFKIDNITITDVPEVRVKNAFQLTTDEAGEMVLSSKTPEDKADWVNLFNQCTQQQAERLKSFAVKPNSAQ